MTASGIVPTMARWRSSTPRSRVCWNSCGRGSSLSERSSLSRGDHGESLGEHNEQTHGYLLYDATLHVPLIIAGPQVASRRRVSEPVRLADVFPTILETAGVSLGSSEGKSLTPALRGDAIEERPSYGESDEAFLDHGGHRSEPDSRWLKFIKTSKPELYNLAKDPRELVNLIAAEPDRARQLETELNAMITAMPQRSAGDVKLAADEQRALKSLGYLGGGNAEQPPAGERRSAGLPDVKDLIRAHNAVQHGRELLARVGATRRSPRSSKQCASFRTTVPRRVPWQRPTPWRAAEEASASAKNSFGSIRSRVTAGFNWAMLRPRWARTVRRLNIIARPSSSTPTYRAEPQPRPDADATAAVRRGPHVPGGCAATRSGLRPRPRCTGDGTCRGTRARGRAWALRPGAAFRTAERRGPFEPGDAAREPAATSTKPKSTSEAARLSRKTPRHTSTWERAAHAAMRAGLHQRIERPWSETQNHKLAAQRLQQARQLQSHQR